ncbi:uncharacterized protein DEA37_0014855 [Paragonimus westermani]|uniref:Uncharacterized protein n=1 Tax=Paragonimus westermani TaxID=34504 RepID=A0A5J4NPI6_9TREM|nr:uncharacterized protein DEA37_0014855 [Paragonimus westermani]
MEWSGCGVFRRLRRFLPKKGDRKVQVSSQLTERKNQSPLLEPVATEVHQVHESGDATLTESLTSTAEQGPDYIDRMTTSSSMKAERNTTVSKVKAISISPSSAHIPYRSIPLFGFPIETVADGTEKDTDRKRTGEDTSLSSHFGGDMRMPKYEPIPNGHVNWLSAFTPDATRVLKLTQPDNTNVNSGPFGVNQIEQIRPDRWMRKTERFAIPRRSDELLKVLARIENQLTYRPDLSRSELINMHRALRPNYPYLRVKPTYQKLNREERLKELRRGIRLELKTKVDCDLSRRLDRPRRVYQTPVGPRIPAPAYSTQLLTQPLPLSSLLRLGVTYRPRLPCLRADGNTGSKSPARQSHHRRHDQNHHHRMKRKSKTQWLESNSLVRGSQKPNADQLIKMYTLVADWVYRLPAEDPTQIDLQRWNGHGSEEWPKQVTNGYPDIFQGLPVKYQKTSQRNARRKRGKHDQLVSEQDIISDSVNVEVCLNKVLLEGVDWREGLLFQGLSLNQEVGAVEEQFLRRLIALERLQLLTRLEESEVMNPDYEMHYTNQRITHIPRTLSLTDPLQHNFKRRKSAYLLPLVMEHEGPSKLHSTTESITKCGQKSSQPRNVQYIKHRLPRLSGRSINLIASRAHPWIKQTSRLGPQNKITPNGPLIQWSPTSTKTAQSASGDSDRRKRNKLPNIQLQSRFRRQWNNSTPLPKPPQPVRVRYRSFRRTRHSTLGPHNVASKREQVERDTTRKGGNQPTKTH